MYCSNCGKEIDKAAVVCPHCGVPTENANKDVDNGGFLWGLLGCCIPIVGLILFLVWKDDKPKTAKAAGIGALVSVGCVVFFYVLLFIIGMYGASLNSGY
ncbi:zinc ribbon domain-containing protein [Enterococcus plantarum]|uniref:Zinc ribbon domain-containing protein n=1 Tax=Enterococcus plantarum TaxID=1077675 RepID=A0A2W3ZQS2_9ENTE|nr:zinc ribbon domain-containing protein [Enterococcus plantarum]MBO0421731.1 zinc ribbon domain-containing protein [Enterococcus plantarum]MBO0466088.1 zinc ribbon domain-containing protein [Enterococcus plantarum]PZL76444.1 zinc ribbon domain-containing protein [Enterococcus plantarum]